MNNLSPILSNAMALHPLFEANPALWNAVSTHVHKKLFKRNNQVFLHGNDANNLWLVYRGWVKLSRQTPDGKETILGLCTEGDVLGEASLFAGASYPYTAEAVGGDAELAYIPATAVQTAAAKDAAISHRIMQLINEHMSQAQLKLEHRNTLSAAQRLGCFLLRLCHTQKEGGKTLHIPIEKTILAAYLGMKPETLSRSQQQLKPMGIAFSRAKVTIHTIARLSVFVCGSCSESGNCNIEASAS